MQLRLLLTVALLALLASARKLVGVGLGLSVGAGLGTLP